LGAPRVVVLTTDEGCDAGMRATWDEAKGSQTQLADDGLRITALKKKTALPHAIAANRPFAD